MWIYCNHHHLSPELLLKPHSLPPCFPLFPSPVHKIPVNYNVDDVPSLRPLQRLSIALRLKVQLLTMSKDFLDLLLLHSPFFSPPCSRRSFQPRAALFLVFKHTTLFPGNDHAHAFTLSGSPHRSWLPFPHKAACHPWSPAPPLGIPVLTICFIFLMTPSQVKLYPLSIGLLILYLF